MKKKVKSSMPKFKSREEEAKFWENNSLADYWDEFEPVDILVQLQKPKEESPAPLALAI